MAYRNTLCNNTEHNWLQFKTERNIVVKLEQKKSIMIDLNRGNPTTMWKTLKEVIRNESVGLRKAENIDFKILDNIKRCNIADKFNMYYIQSISIII